MKLMWSERQDRLAKILNWLLGRGHWAPDDHIGGYYDRWGWWDKINTKYWLRKYPPPPLIKDRVARHFGFVDGVPACTENPCEHGWEPFDWDNDD